MTGVQTCALPILLTASGAGMIETQSNDALLTVIMHAFAPSVTSESVLFHDQLTTAHSPPGAMVRRTTPDDAAQMRSLELDPEAAWVVEVEGTIAGAGGILPEDCQHGPPVTGKESGPWPHPRPNRKPLLPRRE